MAIYTDFLKPSPAPKKYPLHCQEAQPYQTSRDDFYALGGGERLLRPPYQPRASDGRFGDSDRVGFPPYSWAIFPSAAPVKR